MISFRLHDVVTRMGEDEQIITGIDDLCLSVVCIKAGGIYRIGEKEDNLIRRYNFVRHGLKDDIPVIEDGVINS